MEQAVSIIKLYEVRRRMQMENGHNYVQRFLKQLSMKCNKYKYIILLLYNCVNDCAA